MKRDWLSKEEHIFQTQYGRLGYRGTIHGVGRREKIFRAEVKTLKQAIRARDQFIALVLSKKKQTELKIPRVEEICEDLLKLKIKKSPKTFESAELHLFKHIVPWFNARHPYIDEFNEATVENYLEAQMIKTPGRKLFNDVKHLRMIARMAYKRGYLQRPLEIKNPDPPREAGKRLSSEEIKRLYHAASFELKGQILMGVTMGMRKSEILLLAWDRVNLKNQTIHLRAQDTKIRRARTMGMSEQVSQWLAARADARFNEPSPFVFPSRYDLSKPTRSNKTAWNACKRRAKVACRFHHLRHTYLSVALLEKKHNPLHVAVYAGVSLSEIEKTYLHPTVEDTRSVALSWGGIGGGFDHG